MAGARNKIAGSCAAQAMGDAIAEFKVHFRRARRGEPNEKQVRLARTIWHEADERWSRGFADRNAEEEHIEQELASGAPPLLPEDVSGKAAAKLVSESDLLLEAVASALHVACDLSEPPHPKWTKELQRAVERFHTQAYLGFTMHGMKRAVTDDELRNDVMRFIAGRVRQSLGVTGYAFVAARGRAHGDAAATEQRVKDNCRKPRTPRVIASRRPTPADDLPSRGGKTAGRPNIIAIGSADGNYRRVRRRVDEVVPTTRAGTEVAGGRDAQQPGRVGVSEGLRDRGSGIDGCAIAVIGDDDACIDGPLERCDDPAPLATASSVEDTQRYELRQRRNTDYANAVVFGDDDAGDVRTVALRIVGIAVVIDEVPSTRETAVEVGMIAIDARVEDGNPDPCASHAAVQGPHRTHRADAARPQRGVGNQS